MLIRARLHAPKLPLRLPGSHADITLSMTNSNIPLGLAGFREEMRTFQLPDRDAGQGTAASPGENFNLPSNAESERRLISIRDTIPRDLVVSSCLCYGVSGTSPRPILGQGGIHVKQIISGAHKCML